MYPPCSLLNDRIFPVIRTLVAKKLSDDGFSQSRIAYHLGISQAMVSKYLTRPLQGGFFDEAEYLASEMVGLIESGSDKAVVTGLLCQWCFNFKEKGLLCPHHPVEHCSICMTLRSREAVGERYYVLTDLENAVKTLGKVDIKPLSPQVRINIAQALSGAENVMDVASIPGRLVPLGNGLRALAPPEFGVSRHLSSLLLRSMKVNPEFRAVMDILYDANVESALGKSRLHVAVLDRSRHCDPEDFLDSGAWDGEAVVVDPGDFGIEPCTYLFGLTAPLVVEKALRLLRLIASDDKIKDDNTNIEQEETS